MLDRDKTRTLGPAAAMKRFVEVRGLVLLLLSALAGWIFFGLAGVVLDGQTRAFDAAILLAFRAAGDLSDPIGPAWVEEVMRDVIGLGGIGILTFVTLAVAVLFWLKGRPWTILYLIVAVGGGAILSSLAKGVFARPRPDLVPHEAVVFSASFPSGHSMMAAVVYLSLAALVARVEDELRVKVYVLALAAVLVASIGVSRV